MVKKTVKEALNAFFLEQEDSGLWGKRSGDCFCDVLSSGKSISKSSRKNAVNAFIF